MLSLLVIRVILERTPSLGTRSSGNNRYFILIFILTRLVVVHPTHLLVLARLRFFLTNTSPLSTLAIAAIWQRLFYLFILILYKSAIHCPANKVYTSVILAVVVIVFVFIFFFFVVRTGSGVIFAT
ncbi:unnamed protein product [Fusarium graminearum]|nr:unnamed protein product [Fusarium graminearum]CAG1993599.1 unnamed protein product [Fusarium graminearum]VTO87137.1 unnamed protein product [Fusarium graminearum]